MALLTAEKPDSFLTHSVHDTTMAEFFRYHEEATRKHGNKLKSFNNSIEVTLVMGSLAEFSASDFFFITNNSF